MATVEEPKPAVTTDAGVVEPTAAPAETLTADKPVEAVEPKTEEPAKTEGEPAAATEEKKEEKAEEKPVEPVYSGALGYKAPGLKNAFRFSKKYFWFGEEPVPVQSLSHYLRGEKAETAHPTAAWSSQTGKGLLYFVKHADQKETPAGVLNLAEATDLTKDGIVAFHFKLHGHKHAFEGATKLERDGWYVAVEKTIEDAKAAKESIVGSDGYKEEIGKLGKPAALAAAVAKDSTPKKSTDAPKPAEGEPSASTEVAAAPARTGSSSSSSSDEEKKKKKKANKSKSRSVSRGKRASIFGGFFGNKDKEEKKEEKKEEEEAKKEETPAPAAEASAVSATAPVITEDIPKVGEELKNETAAVPAAEPTPATTTAEAPKEETKPAEEKPKPTKRGSIFGSFVEKLKSPTTEKKESEVAPAPPAKDPETTAEAPKIEEPAAASPAPVDGATEAPKEEAKPATTPAKEKQHFSFGKFLGGAKEKVKSPTTEKSPVEAAKTTEEPAKTEETPAPAPAAPVEPAAEAPKEEATKPAEEAPATTTPATKPKRGSIFGNLTGSVKKEKEGETSDKPKGLSGLFRQASKAGKSKKEKESAATAPAKVEEETPAAEPAKEEKQEQVPAAEPASIGDVVPGAVSVGEAPKSTPQVSASA